MNYLSDTNSKIESVQIALLRQAGPTKGLMRMQSLSQTIADLSRRAIIRSHPEFNRQEVDIFFVRLHYGEKIAEHLRNYLDRQKQ